MDGHKEIYTGWSAELVEFEAKTDLSQSFMRSR
jgi:hypothetical protein